MLAASIIGSESIAGFQPRVSSALGHGKKTD